MSAPLFEQFRKNLAVRNHADIAVSYAEITKRLNKDFWASDSESVHSLQVGSYGRGTAIDGVSDLDMVFELPWSVYDRLSKVKGNGPSQLLQEVRTSILERYPRTKVKGDGQVVAVRFDTYVVEVLPAFLKDDGSYLFGDSNDGGGWRECRPRKEMSAISEVDTRANRNLKRICKMLRAWRNEHGAPMSGMLIDTLTYRFFQNSKTYDDKSYGAYPDLLVEVFQHLAEQPDNDYWLAPGSEQHVGSSGRFQARAKHALARCREAYEETSKAKQVRLWREVFGSPFPLSTETAEKAEAYQNTERFIENYYPVDISYSVSIDAEVLHQESRVGLLRRMMAAWVPVGRRLRFFIASCAVPPPYAIYWKVRNVGRVAEQRNEIRGQIIADTGQGERVEHTKFAGPHFVECYVVKDGICVARDRIAVPIPESR